ncbi:hypothetical protein BWB39_04085 [Salmonella enterica subsp. enterica serovar Enteritidis]|nr:hypothetical protein [Salmonella enterica subsp. enterica serovar Enteritidis]EDE1793850.1 hypothetical protein [Salmonella enterica subsp. enterica serovar Enteritidis]EGW3959613.1 hypothetical protein [Salmonella enterica subsp. enterica serovar Enteritidis]
MTLSFTARWRDELPATYTALLPTPLKNARLIWYNDKLAQQLAIPASLFDATNGAGVWGGETLLPGMSPVAQVYSGHQFGVWAGQLGDGRGILLGEQLLEDGSTLDWHLKGAGLTPYSRMGDGRAVLRSTIRESLASEAMHYLGIPTTRALSIVTSDTPVQRETQETGAMLMRLAQTLTPFIEIDALNRALDRYQDALLTHYGQRMRQKLGFFTEQKDDNVLLNELFSLMAREGSDYTRTFRMLSHTEQQSASSPLRDTFIDRAAFDAWFDRYRARLRTEAVDDALRQQQMQSVNPAVVLRNWLAQRAIDAAEQGDMAELHRLHEILRQPFIDRDDDYASRPPEWGKRLEVSCSS